MPDGPLSARVYDEILGRILGGTMKPGHVFNRRQLAAELSVSVAPVLEAMLELEGEGLIETLPRKGTRVRTLSLQDLADQLIVREALECQAARLYCGGPVRRHQARLTRMAADIDAGAIDSVARLKDEVRFHHLLVSLADCPPLTEAFERVMKVGMLYSIQVLHPDPAGALRSSHVRLVRELTTLGPVRAEAAIRAHVKLGKEALFDRLNRGDGADLPRAPRWLRD